MNKGGYLAGFAAALLLIFLGLLFMRVAEAVPIAKATHAGHLVVLTDNVDEELCPVGTRIALLHLKERTAVGCWKLGEEDVHILWLVPDSVGKGAFEDIKPDVTT